MKFITTFFAVIILFNTVNAMNLTGFSNESLGISNSENVKSNVKHISYSKNNENVLFDESIIDQLITSFPDTLESYRSNKPEKNMSYYELLIDAYSS